MTLATISAVVARVSSNVNTQLHSDVPTPDPRSKRFFFFFQRHSVAKATCCNLCRQGQPLCEWWQRMFWHPWRAELSRSTFDKGVVLLISAKNLGKRCIVRQRGSSEKCRRGFVRNPRPCASMRKHPEQAANSLRSKSLERDHLCLRGRSNARQSSGIEKFLVEAEALQEATSHFFTCDPKHSSSIWLSVWTNSLNLCTLRFVASFPVRARQSAVSFHQIGANGMSWNECSPLACGGASHQKPTSLLRHLPVCTLTVLKSSSRRPITSHKTSHPLPCSL